MINVLIAEDHTLFARLVASMLEDSDDINVVGIAPNGEEALSMLGDHKVDVILLDINMPKIDGMEATKRIVKEYPNLRIIILSSHTEAWVIQKALKSGASGYLTKFVESAEVTEAIKTVSKGESYFCKTSLDAIMKNLVNQDNQASPSEQYKALTNREKQILQLISKEFKTSEIAEQLSISFRTVETHRKNILHKLGAKNTVGLIKAAMEANLIEGNL